MNAAKKSLPSNTELILCSKPIRNKPRAWRHVAWISVQLLRLLHYRELPLFIEFHKATVMRQSVGLQRPDLCITI